MIQNFEFIKQFEAHLLASHGQDVVKSSVKDILLHHLLEIFKKVSLSLSLSLHMILISYC